MDRLVFGGVNLGIIFIGFTLGMGMKNEKWAANHQMGR
jgi:hypothetical protein